MANDGTNDTVVVKKNDTGESVVTFNGVVATDVEVVSPNEIHAITPAGATGPAQVVVTNPNGQKAAVTGAFRYDSPFDPKGGCTSRPRSVRH